MKMPNCFKNIFKGKEIKKEDSKISPNAHTENQNENSTNKEILVVPIISTEEKLDKGIILKLLSVAFSFFGFYIIHSYLNSIDRLNLFPELIFSINFIYIAMVSIFFSILISLTFVMPYLYAIAFKHTLDKLHSLEEIKILSFNISRTSFISIVILFSIYLALDYFDIKLTERFSLMLISISIIIPIFYFICIYKRINKNLRCFNSNIINSYFNILLIQCFYLSFFVFFVYINFSFNKESIYITLCNIFCWIFLSIINIGVTKDIFHNKKFNKDALSFLAISTFIMFSVFYGFSDTINQRLLYPLRFVEIPKNSSWYLLQNNPYTDKSEFIINGIKYTDLKEIKGIFTKESKENDLSCHRANSRSNALYGYMAWNLGETKVFCPESVGETNDYSKCLTINGSLLQPLDAQYIQ